MASDSDNEESFVNYGTPLEPLEEDEPLRKPVPLHEQTVKDEKGRYQRFHGAFTGGFSAGYYNTVGSKEGWTPSTFVSSRQQKAEKQSARPEDFMDEEDFGEHGIAPHHITTSSEFSSGRRDEIRDKALAVMAQTSIIAGDMLLEELIAPARLSIGMELLKKMGWKEGQGVGPRVKRKPRSQRTDGAKMYGCALPPGGSEDSQDEDDEEFAPENVTYAPKDVIPIDFSIRSGVRGLGYSGLDPGLALQGRGASEHINLFDPHSAPSRGLFGDIQGVSRRRGGVAGQAFGVGALEDEDEDIYQRDNMSKYDTVLGGEEPGDGLYGWTAPEEYRKKGRSRELTYLGKILEGFTLAQKPPEKKEIFPPPVLPRNYRPVHRPRLPIDVSRLTGLSTALTEALKASRGHMVQEKTEDAGGGGRHQLDSNHRRSLLGEDTLQGPRSVMELLRPQDRERLLSLRTTNKLSAPSPHPTQAPAGESPLPSSASMPSLQLQQDALAAWKGKTSTQAFKPFTKNPSKQARYELYLKLLQQGQTDALEQSMDPTMTEWERSREREEFARASILFRPTSSFLSTRFTQAKYLEDEDIPEISSQQEDNSEDKQTPSKVKVFGKLTRETLEWHPDKLLCKRFNVPDPYPGSGTVGLLKVKRDKFSVFNFLSVTESGETSGPKPLDPGKKSRWDVSDQKEESKKDNDPLSHMISTVRSQASEAKPDTPALPAPPTTSKADSRAQVKPEESSSNRKKGGDEEEEEEVEEEESRPPMDLFKAIFASSDDKSSSSSESGEEEEEEGKEEEGKVNSEPFNLFNIPSTSVTTTSVTTTSVTTTAVTSTSSAPSSQTAVSMASQEAEEFGPKLPPPSAAPARGGATSLLPPSQEDRAGRKDKKHKSKKQHKHKEKKKKKHKKHKRKGGKQQKNKREESDSSSQEDEVGGRLTPEELLRRLKSVRSQQMW